MIRLCSVDRTTRRLFLGDKHADLIQHLAVRAKCQPKRVMAVLRQYRCRECLRYSRAHARTLSGRTVIVCVTCSRKPDAYSTLWDHKTALRAYDAHVGWKVRKRVWLESLCAPPTCKHKLATEKHERSTINMTLTLNPKP